MADTALALVAKMQVQLNDLEKGMKKAGLIADKGVKDIEGKFARANPKLPAAFGSDLKKLFAGIGAAAAAHAFREMIANIGDLNDEAQRLGVSTDFIQEFRHAVELSGGTVEDASLAMQKFAKQLSDAQAGSVTPFSKAFGNISVQGLSVEQAMARAADIIKGATTSVDKLNYSSIFFGKNAGPAVLNAVSDGAEGLAEMAYEAQRLGIVIDSKLIKSGADLDDMFTRLEETASAWVKTLVLTLAQDIPNVLAWIQKIKEAWFDLNNIGVLVHRRLTTPFAQPGFTAPTGMLDTFAKEKLKAAGQQFGPLPQLVPGQQRLSSDLAAFYDMFPESFQPAPKSNVPPSPHPPRIGGGGARGPKDRAPEVIENLQLELDKVNAIGDARDDIILKEKILQELRSANVDATSAEGKKIIEMVTALDAAERAQRKLVKLMDDFRDVAAAGFDTVINDLFEGKKAVDALNDGLRDMLSTILRISEQKLLEGLLGESGTAGGGAFGSFLANLFRQGGGPVSANRPYIVGEHGPELMVPQTAGTIIPNHALAPGSDAGGVQINIINQSGSQIQKRERNQGGKPIIDILVAEMGKRIGNGDFDGAMRGRYGARPTKVR
jgi:hypothetical protein